MKEYKIVVTPWFPMLGIAFVVLKLTNVITWSWWWVTAPFWAVPAVCLSIAAVAFVLWLILEGIGLIWPNTVVTKKSIYRRRGL
jgi:hypothetical protein